METDRDPTREEIDDMIVRAEKALDEAEWILTPRGQKIVTLIRVLALYAIMAVFSLAVFVILFALARWIVT